jgi:hypothetical protein
MAPKFACPYGDVLLRALGRLCAKLARDRHADAGGLEGAWRTDIEQGIVGTFNIDELSNIGVTQNTGCLCPVMALQVTYKPCPKL